MKDKDQLETNLEIFSRFCPDYVDEVKNADCSNYEVFPSNNGSPNLKKKENENREVVYHSIENPEREAEIWVESLPSVRETECIVVFGVGLGYYFFACKEWLKENQERFLIFMEPDFSVLKLLFSSQIGNEIISHPQVVILGIKPESFNEKMIRPKFFGMASLLLYDSAVLFTALKASALLLPEVWKSTKQILQIQIREMRFKSSFFMPSVIRSVLSNSVENYWKITRSKLFYGLEGCLKGIPAVICGAGPSLVEDLTVLEEKLDSFLLIGAGSGMNVLNKHQLFPPLGIGIDQHDTSRSRILTNFSYLTPFCFRTTFNYEALNIIHGPKLYFRSVDFTGVNGWFEKMAGLNRLPNIFGDVSTTSVCVSVAHALGCNPIILIGVDLAYTEKLRYPKDITVHPVDPEKEKEKLTLVSEQDIIHARGIDGKTVHTRRDWIREANVYKNFAESVPNVKFINSTSRGLEIHDLEHLSIEKVAAKYFSVSLDIDNLIHAQLQNCPDVGLEASKVKEIMETWLESVELCKSLVEEMLEELSSSLIRLNEDPNCEEDFKSGRLVELEEKLRKEVVYGYYLSNLEINYHMIFFRFYFHITYREDLFTKRELVIKKIENYQNLLLYFVQNLNLHKKYFEESLQKHADLGIPPVIENQLNNIKLPTGRDYSFENGLISIHDEELNLHFEEKFNPQYIAEGGSSHVQGILNFAAMNNDLPEGQCLIYYPDGEKKGECFYKNGQLHGPSTFYSKEGNVLAKGWYIQNKKEGKNFQYYPSGRVSSIKRFKEGELHGRQEYFYESGFYQAVIHYKNGKLDGRVSLYFPDGVLRREVNFLEGKLHGKERMWNEKVHLIFESEFSNDLPCGITRHWYPNGQLERKIRYYDSPDHFDLMAWNEAGEVIENVEYHPETMSKELEEKSLEVRGDIQRLKEKLKRMKKQG